MKRTIRIVFKDGSSKDLVLGKATKINSDIGMLHLDKIKDNNWRLTFSEDIAEEFSSVDKIDIVRED